MRDVAYACSTVLDQLSATSGFAVPTFIADGEFKNDAGVPLLKRLGVLTTAVATVLSRSITSGAGIWDMPHDGVRGGLTSGAGYAPPPL